MSKSEERRIARLEKYRSHVSKIERHYIHSSSPVDDIKSIPRWGVFKNKEKLNRKLLIIGTGRCGTDFMSRLFISNGYDVPHERIGKFGGSSHWFITDSEWYPVLTFASGLKAHIGQRKSDYNFEKIIHLIRNPLDTIRSISNIFRSTDFDFLVHNGIIPENIIFKGKKRFYKGMILYYYVNKFILDNFKNSLLVKIENIKNEIPKICSFLKIKQLNIPSEKPTNTSKNILGFRLSKEEADFGVLKAIDFELASKIWHLSKNLGYSI